MIWSAVIAAIVGGLAGGLAGWAGSYHIHKKITNLHSADELRRSFYEYFKLSSNYWLLDDKNNAVKREVIEAQMIVTERIISIDYSILAKRNKRIKKAYESTVDERLELWDAATNGCFQQKDNWQPDQERVKRVASAVTRLVKSLY